jgi:hypothetical protein
MDSSEPKVKMPKAKLPTKTKIAVWWLVVVGVLLIAYSIYCLLFASIMSFDTPASERGELFLIMGLCLLGSILYFLSGIFISRQSKQAWRVTVTVLSIVTICPIGFCIYSVINDLIRYGALSDYSYIPIALLGSLILLTPLILIVLDRKNYFTILRQRELEKKENR